ncbi:Inositol monophosphatase [Penicillium brevicompactum]|uniref:Inositol monophosphatase n=1 Tax=Penicillium brevicompactum TaxID=5074 RepID=UPI002540E432|nr:Inositol monophosphatase [Penicillium brevicompactum]KAJ5348258.1 Inositol monophosphatase [Penicillium brevicompactum]
MSTPSPYAKELQLASLAVQRAALLTEQLLSAVDKGALDKSDDSPVTIADFAAQASIIAAIHNVFPEDDIVGEEDATALRSNPTLLERTWDLATSVHLDDAASEAQLHTPATRDELLDLIDLGAKGACTPTSRTWTLDPVDGTATFIRGEQVLLFGRWARGALLPARALEKVPQVAETARVSFIDTRAAKTQDLEAHGRVAATLGCPWPNPVDLWSAQMRYVAIAVQGGCNAFIKLPLSDDYRSKIWDHAGGMLIVQELGVLVTDLEGRPVDCSQGRTLASCHGMVVGPASVHGRIVEAVKQVRGL